MMLRGKKPENKLRDGRGCGQGASYKPWLTVREVPTKGRATRTIGIKTGRVHVLFSDIERGNFYYLEHLERVIDIREQYPLPLKSTVDIAAHLGILHPKAGNPRELVIMTTDFLVDFADGSKAAYACKSEAELNGKKTKRVLEKLEIERTYWESLGIQWSILTENSFPKTLVNNIMSLRDVYSLDNMAGLPDSRTMSFMEIALSKAIQKGEPPIIMTHQLDANLELEPGTSLLLLRHFIATRKILVDLRQPLRWDRPICTKEEKKCS